MIGGIRVLRLMSAELFFSAAVYWLWRQRNDVKHGNAPRAEEKVIQDVVWDVKNRIRGKGKYKE